MSGNDCHSADPDAEPLPKAVTHRAVEWLVLLQESDEPDDVWQLILSWRKEHPHHESAWQHIEAVNRKFGILSGSDESLLAHKTLESPDLTKRKATKFLFVILAAGSMGWYGYRRQPWILWRADFHTDVGQQNQVMLANGTTLTLNSDSAVNVRNSGSETLVVLLKGEIHLHTQDGPKVAEPAIVDTAYGRLRPLGTRFSVRLYSEACQLSVFDGEVQLSQVALAESVVVRQGSGVRFTSDSQSTQQSVSDNDAAWVHGQIVASRMRMQDFLSELDRYHKGKIYSAPEIADIEVSGTYHLYQLDQVLDALPRAFPVRVRRFTRFWIQVLPAD